MGYCSKKFVDNEVGWNIVEKEGFAILYGVRYFHHYLAGRRFTVNCDNRVNCYIRDKKKPSNSFANIFEPFICVSNMILNLQD